MKYLLLLVAILLSGGATAAPILVDPDSTPTGIYTCDVPTTLGDTNNTPMDIGDIERIDFEVSNDDQATWTPAGNSIAGVSGPAKCWQSYDLSGSPDGTYFYRSVYTHVNGQTSPMTPIIEVKLERPLILLPMTNPQFQAQ